MKSSRRFKKLKDIHKADVVIILVFVLIALTMIYPFYYVIIMSVANAVSLAKHSPYSLPFVVDWTGYKVIFRDKAFFSATMVSVFVTVVGTMFSMFLSVMGAYVLAKKELIGRRFFLSMILFTMLFSGGLVPTYLNIKNLQLVNSVWCMILPCGISTYYMIIMKNYFLTLPASLEEAAKIDGANPITILVKIILPISKPFMATFALFYAVERWNEWYNALLYINESAKQPLQIYLREVLISMNQQLSIQAQMMMGKGHRVLNSGIQMACVVVTMIPVLCVYPFAQKHLIKGIMVGGLKE